jgi:hypothetical protein
MGGTPSGGRPSALALPTWMTDQTLTGRGVPNEWNERIRGRTVERTGARARAEREALLPTVNT